MLFFVIGVMFLWIETFFLIEILIESTMDRGNTFITDYRGLWLSEILSDFSKLKVKIPLFCE